MTKWLTGIYLWIVCLLLPCPVLAVNNPLSVPNNNIGIHLLEPSEVEVAASLVNSSGGDWGYVTIPVRANDRNFDKWQKFMDDCRSKHLIPIIRIATYANGDSWAAPNEYDLIDFANFLNDLVWPTKNRYVIIYNEPNHKSEWGGYVYPEEYAAILNRAIDIFHSESSDFFIISAGMDSSAPDSNRSMNIYRYFSLMEQKTPGIFSRVDGLSFHAYGNPDFSTYPNYYSRVNVASYRFEMNYLCRNFNVCEKPIFLTEVGWEINKIGEWAAKNYYHQALNYAWNDNKIVAITPFLLDARAGPFEGFSFVNKNGKLRDFTEVIISYPKTRGQPELNPQPSGTQRLIRKITSEINQNFPKDNPFTVFIVNFLKMFR